MIKSLRAVEVVGAVYLTKKNGKKLTLSTVETYDIFMNPEQYGIETIDTKQAFKNNYITLETLNTIYLIAEKEDWHYLV